MKAVGLQKSPERTEGEFIYLKTTHTPKGYIGNNGNPIAERKEGLELNSILRR